MNMDVVDDPDEETRAQKRASFGLGNLVKQTKDEVEPQGEKTLREQFEDAQKVAEQRKRRGEGEISLSRQK